MSDTISRLLPTPWKQSYRQSLEFLKVLYFGVFHQYYAAFLGKNSKIGSRTKFFIGFVENFCENKTRYFFYSNLWVNDKVIKHGFESFRFGETSSISNWSEFGQLSCWRVKIQRNFRPDQKRCLSRSWYKGMSL